jgi:molybdate transport system substrate-binding protein
MTTIRILSGGAVKRGVAMVAERFGEGAGLKVECEFTPVPRLLQRMLEGEAADVVVATPAVMDELAAAGRIDPATRGRVGSSRMGIVIHADAPDLPLPDEPAFRAALLGATRIVYNRASTGVYIEKLLAGLGLAEALAPKIAVVGTGSEVMRGVEAGGIGALGFGQISEAMVLMDKGCRVKLAAPLPPVAAKITTYDAAAAAASARPQQAAALARALASSEVKALFAKTGIS